MNARRLGYEAICLTCESTIFPDERAFTEHGVGAWHEDCDMPRNLKLYQRERDTHNKRKRRQIAQDFDDDVY